MREFIHIPHISRLNHFGDSTEDFLVLLRQEIQKLVLATQPSMNDFARLINVLSLVPSLDRQ